MGELSAAYYKGYDSSYIFWYKLSSSVTPFLFFIGLPCALLALLVTVARGRHADPSQCASRVNEQCGFVGDPDFYGLGIRLGVYMQWLASWIANASLPGERRSLAGGYAIFSLSLAIALLILALGTSCTFDAEVIVILSIFFGGVFNVVAPLAGADDVFGSVFYGFRPSSAQTDPLAPAATEQDSPIRTNNPTFTPRQGLRSALSILIHPMTVFSAWFWIGMGEDNTSPFTPTPCGTGFFLFARITPEHVSSASRFMAFCSLWLAATPYLALLAGLLTRRKLSKIALVPIVLSITFWTNFVIGFLYGFFKNCCNYQVPEGDEIPQQEQRPQVNETPPNDGCGHDNANPEGNQIQGNNGRHQDDILQEDRRNLLGNDSQDSCTAQNNKKSEFHSKADGDEPSAANS